jgi:SAM-dependent methyltransferase
MHEYTSDFYAYQEPGSMASAEVVVPLLRAHLRIRSVLDVGCGRGIWLSVWRRMGVEDVAGVDGKYVDRERLHIATDRFAARDLVEGFDLGRSFDLVSSLEVAEHLPATASAGFVDSLTRHGSMVLFSAAVPGQGGENHINEQSYEAWRSLFAAKGYRAFDPLRPAIRVDLRVEPWYRYNLLLYVHDDVIPGLPPEIASSLVPDGTSIPDLCPLPYRLRKAVLRQLPIAAVTSLAQLNARLKVWSRSGAAS